jgi:hypothetical protein
MVVRSHQSELTIGRLRPTPFSHDGLERQTIFKKLNVSKNLNGNEY